MKQSSNKNVRWELHQNETGVKWIKKTTPQVQIKLTHDERLSRRRHQVNLGKATLGFRNYCLLKSCGKDVSCEPPDIKTAVSKRQFDRMVREWRRNLHSFDDIEKFLQPYDVMGRYQTYPAHGSMHYNLPSPSRSKKFSSFDCKTPSTSTSSGSFSQSWSHPMHDPALNEVFKENQYLKLENSHLKEKVEFLKNLLKKSHHMLQLSLLGSYPLSTKPSFNDYPATTKDTPHSL